MKKNKIRKQPIKKTIWYWLFALSFSISSVATLVAFLFFMLFGGGN